MRGDRSQKAYQAVAPMDLKAAALKIVNPNS